jgi:hypothetical protein
VPEHAHDWPVLSLFVIGGYSNRTEIGETFIAAPSAILYRAPEHSGACSDARNPR